MVTSKSVEVGDRILKVTFCFILMEEIWKDIKGYEGLYQVSNLGRIKSLARYVYYRNGKVYHQDEKILKPCLNNKGYCRVRLTKSTNSKLFFVHRLVAMAFIPNPNNFPQINHKDENKQNNSSNNLEWCTSLYNNNFGKKKESNKNERQKKQVFAENIKNGEYLILKSISEGKNYGFTQQCISNCCLGKQKKHKGFRFRYLDSLNLNNI